MCSYFRRSLEIAVNVTLIMIHSHLLLLRRDFRSSKCHMCDRLEKN